MNAARQNKKIDRTIKDTLARQKFLTPYWLTMDQEFVGTGFDQPGVQLTAAQPVQDVFFLNRLNNTLLMTILMGDFFTTQAGGETTEGFAIEIFDPQGERPLQTQPVTLNCGIGTASLPFFLPVPLQVGCNESIRVRITNLLTGAGTTTIFLTFFGVAVWNKHGVYKNYMATGEEST
jgi:hypothetical protein